MDEYAPTPKPASAVTSADLLAEMANHAEQNPLTECCGLLLGLENWRDGALIIDEIVPSQNMTGAATEDSFEIDPALHLRLRRDLRGTGRAVVGLYHSHPNGAAHPSALDEYGARLEPGLLWLIIPMSARAVGAAEAVARSDPQGVKSRFPAAFWSTRQKLVPMRLQIAEK